MLINDADEAPLPLHPSMAGRYRKEVGQLVEALNDPGHWTEAASLIRDLVDRIVLTPNQERTDLMIGLHGDLAGILTAANGKTLQAGARGGKSKHLPDDRGFDAVTV